MTNNCKTIKYTNHAIEFMAKRNISDEEVELCIQNGETVENFPDDKPFPSELILYFINGRPIHIVLASDSQSKTCFVITSYEPTFEKFESDYKTRRKKS